MYRMWLLLALLASAPAWAGGAKAARCTAALRIQAGAMDHFRPPVEGEVIGKGRAYFHHAPQDDCLRRGFIVPGDFVTVYRSLGAWYEVMYIGRDGTETQGWLRGDRLRLHAAYGADREVETLPADVRAFVERREACEHFAGEEPYDAERRAYLARAIKETCTGGDRELETLRRRHADQPAVISRLAAFEPMGL